MTELKLTIVDYHRLENHYSENKWGYGCFVIGIPIYLFCIIYFLDDKILKGMLCFIPLIFLFVILKYGKFNDPLIEKDLKEQIKIATTITVTSNIIIFGDDSPDYRSITFDNEKINSINVIKTFGDAIALADKMEVEYSKNSGLIVQLYFKNSLITNKDLMIDNLNKFLPFKEY